MLETEQIHRLIGDIYDAAIDPSRWNAVLARAQHFVGGPAAAVIGALRGEPLDLVDAETRYRLRQIAPHVQRAARIAHTIEARTSETAMFATTFDGLSAGMFLVDADGRIVHANASGRALLAQGSPLRAGSGRLAAAGSCAALADAIGARGQRESTGPRRCVAVPLIAADGVRYMAHVLPLSRGIRHGAGAGRAAVATVFVRKIAVDESPSLPDGIARHYRLTPAELRVLLAVVRVGGVAETAAALGIGEATVKTHLQRLFGKTGTSRQIELVRLVAGFANPLLN
jgi:DNA-binding CsgD family transcriptional regulator/PAS domain-containing protein